MPSESNPGPRFADVAGTETRTASGLCPCERRTGAMVVRS
jgi:hypothetical protein